MKLQSLLALGADAARVELSSVRAALEHSSQKGNSLESYVKTLLRRHLPERVGVTEGVVVSSSGFHSSQVDIILYDQTEAPIFYNNGSTRIIPLEYVFGVMEVKARLDASSLNDAFEKQRQIKRERKYFQKSGWTYHSYGRNWIAPPTLSLIFAFEGVKTEKLFDQYRQHHNTYPINECVDAIYLNDGALFTRGSDGIGLDFGSGNCSSLQYVEENPLFYFLALLCIVSSGWQVRERAEMYRYVSSSPPSGKQFPQSFTVAHDDITP
jgi:hypothetical protein